MGFQCSLRHETFMVCLKKTRLWFLSLVGQMKEIDAMWRTFSSHDTTRVERMILLNETTRVEKIFFLLRLGLRGHFLDPRNDSVRLELPWVSSWVSNQW
jgi:hypothetical protein